MPPRKAAKWDFLRPPWKLDTANVLGASSEILRAGPKNPAVHPVPRLHFVRACASASDYPSRDPGSREVALIGRSNVGKSSLLNAMGRADRSMARVSRTPGRTQTVNFFRDESLGLVVDLPGHGYAAAPLDVVRRWQLLVRNYVLQRPLSCAYFLVDARRAVASSSRAALSDSDADILRLLAKHSVPFAFVFTKIDHVRPADLLSAWRALEGIWTSVPSFRQVLLPTSSRLDIGLDLLRHDVYSLC